MQQSLPKSYIARMQQKLGEGAADFFLALENEPPVSVRINPSKPFDPLEHFKVSAKVPWSKCGYYLESRPAFTFDPLLHAGCYYVQEASSMFLEHIIRSSMDLSRPLRVLDLCASPGGKSTVLLSLISKDSLLVSNEVIGSRVSALIENIQKWGAENVLVTNNEPRDFERLEGYFDLVLVDAPCSGEGMFRKDPGAILEWSEQNITMCSVRQHRILESANRLVKEGGLLIYSTCTYAEEENERHFQFLNQFFESIEIPINPEWGILKVESSCGFGYQFLPHMVKGEGLFMSCFRKNAATKKGFLKKALKQEGCTKSQLTEIEKWVSNSESMSIIKDHHAELFAVPRSLETDIESLRATLRVRHFGIGVGSLAGNELIPSHSLALSLLLKEGVESVVLDYDQAIAFLQKRDIPVAGDKLGWKLIVYNTKPIGWAKYLKNRVNNYYPKEWRIRSEKVVVW